MPVLSAPRAVPAAVLDAATATVMAAAAAVEVAAAALLWVALPTTADVVQSVRPEALGGSLECLDVPLNAAMGVALLENCLGAPAPSDSAGRADCAARLLPAARALELWPVPTAQPGAC